MKYLLSETRNIDRILARGRVLLASDFDGTLCPVACSPAAAQLTPTMSEALARISGCPQITLAVISGRPLADVRRRVPDSFACAGNHGLEIGGPSLEFEHPEALALRPDLAELCQELAVVAGRWPDAFVEDKRLSATLHHKGLNACARYRLRLAARRCVARFGRKFLLRSGLDALEICPRVGWDKGSALTFIRDGLGPFETCVCMGDDRTDEAMFGANTGGLNVRIGNGGATRASHYLWDPAETAILLEYIACVYGAGAAVIASTEGATTRAQLETA
jgi:trehalose 6-phosphate phosphatase